MKFRKKPVVVEAIQFTADEFWKMQDDSSYGIFGKFVASGHYHPGDRIIHEVYILIDTLEGTMRANLGDWIIKGVNGEFYPCKPDIFEKTYEAVE